MYDFSKFSSVISIIWSNVLHLSICFRNLIPNPTPVCAPSINPGISAIVISLSSYVATPKLGLRVVNL